MRMTKICPVCGKRFETDSKVKIYCSHECKDKAHLIKYHENKNKTELEVKSVYNPNQELVNMAIAARKAGMSYGQYAGKLYLEKQKKLNMRRTASR